MYSRGYFVSYSVMPQFNRTPLQDIYPTFEAIPQRLGWVDMGAGLTDHFSDVWWRFYVNADAGMRIQGPGAALKAPAQRLVILPAWISWQLEMRNPLRHFFLEVECPQISARQIASRYNKAILIPQQQGTLFVDVAQRMQAEEQAADIGHQMHAAVHLAMSHIAQDFADITAQPNVLQQIMTFIEADLQADLRVPTLAQQFHCSPKHITNLFNEHLQITPAAFVRERRIVQACKLLRETEDSIEHIAEACGFANRAYMSRVMQQQVHIAPAAYRKLSSAIAT